MHGWCVSRVYRALGPNRKRALPYRVARAADHSSHALDPSVGHHRGEVDGLCASVPLHSSDLYVQIRTDRKPFDPERDIVYLLMPNPISMSSHASASCSLAAGDQRYAQLLPITNFERQLGIDLTFVVYNGE